MEKYYLYGFIALGILLIVCFIMIYLLYCKLNSIQKKQMKLDEKLSGEKAEDLLYHILEEEKELKRDIKSMRHEIIAIREKQSACFDKVKIVRYHTTTDNEAKLSYSVGLSNEKGDGLVITGLQYRQGCNMYYKQVKEGIPDFDLSQEERISLDRTNAGAVMRKRG
ncbi:MAG: DUF4446 family protein [Clostridia bacterium]